MDLHALSRRDLQALAKRNGVKANMTNAAMADALAALPKVDGIEEYVQQAVAEPEVQAAAAEEEEAEEQEEKEVPEKQGSSPHEVIMLDDSEEEQQDEEKAPATGMGRRRATRRAQIEPVAAPSTRKKEAASKAEKGDAAAEAVPARATRARSQKRVSWADEEAPKARPTTRRAAARKTGTEQEEEEEGTRSGVSDAEAAEPVPASSDEGDDGAENMEAVTDAQNEEQFPALEAEKGDTAAEAVPARATRGRSGRRTVVTVAEEEAPKTRRTSRRAVAKNTSTEQEEQEKEAQADVSNVEAAVSAPASSDNGDDGAEDMEAVTDAQNDEQFAAAEAHAAKAVPARATRARGRRTVVPVAEEEAPMAKRTSRRAVARKTSTEQEVEEKGADMETAAPAPVSSDEQCDAAAEMEVAIDAHSEEQNEPAEEPVEAAEPQVAVPARTTRTRSKRTVVSVADEEAPKARRTSRRAVARRTSTEQEEEEKGTQGDVSDMGAAVSAPTSSDEGGAGAEEIEASVDAQKELQFAAAEAVPARATRARRQRAVVSVAEEEAPKTRRTSRRTGTKQEEKVQCQQQQDIASDVEADVPAPVSSDVGSYGAEEMEAHMESLNDEQNELVESQSEEDEGVAVDRTPLLEEEEPVAEDCPVDSSVEEQTDTVSSEEIQQSCEDTEMLPVQELAEETEDCTAEEETAVAEHVDSSVQEPLVDAQQCEATEEIQLASEDATASSKEIQQYCEDTEMLPVQEVAEENEGCTAEEEPAVAEHVDSSVQEPLVDVQQCEATEEIQLASEDAEMVPLTSGEAAEEADFTSDVDDGSEEADFTSDVNDGSEEAEDCTVEEETPVADDVGSSVQELLVEVQQCEAIKEIHFATEDAEMVSVEEVPQATLTSCEVTEEADFTRDVGHASEENEDCKAEEELPVEEDVQQCEATEEMHLSSEEKEDCMVEEEPVAEDVLQYEATEDVHASEENEDCKAEEELPVEEDVQQCEATEEMHLSSEEKEDCMVEEEPVVEDVLQYEATEDDHLAVEDAEMVHVNEVLQATLNSGEVTEEVDFTSDAGEENEESGYEEVLQSAAKASEKKEDMAAEEETPVATNEMPQMSEAMDVGVVDNLFATVTDDEGAVKESDFSCDLADVSVEEEVVAEDCAVDSSVEEQHDNAPREEIQQSSDESGEAAEETEDCTVEQEPPAPEDVDSSVQELLVDVVEQCQNSPIILGLVEQEGNNTAEEIHSPNEYTEMVPVSDATQASMTSGEAAEEVGFTSESALQSAAKASKDKEDMVAVEVQQWSEAMYEEVVEVVTVDKDESWFISDLTAVFMDEEAAVADDEMPQSSATMEENVEEVVAVKESGLAGDQADVSVEEEENVEEVDQAVAGGHTPVVITARDFSDHITSPFSANVFECATKSLSMDSITVEQSGFTGKLMDMSVEEQGVVAADEMPQSSTMEENVEEVVTFENLPQVTVTDDEWAVTLSAWLENLSQVKEMFTFDNLLQATLTEDEEAAVAADEMLHSAVTKDENVEEVVTVENLSQAKESGVHLQPVVDHTPSPQSANVFQNATKYLSSMDSITAKPTVSEPAAVPLCVYSRSVRKLKITEPMSDALGSRSLRKLRTEFNEIVARENEVQEGKKPSTPLDTLSLRQLKLRLKETLNAQNQKERERTRVPLSRLDENAW